jgi:hypothetical protein
MNCTCTEARELLLYLGSHCGTYSFSLTSNVIHAVYAMRVVDTRYNVLQ